MKFFPATCPCNMSPRVSRPLEFRWRITDPSDLTYVCLRLQTSQATPLIFILLTNLKGLRHLWDISGLYSWIQPIGHKTHRPYWTRGSASSAGRRKKSATPGIRCTSWGWQGISSSGWTPFGTAGALGSELRQLTWKTASPKEKPPWSTPTRRRLAIEISSPTRGRLCTLPRSAPVGCTSGSQTASRQEYKMNVTQGIK